jgi:hypothetical protein
MELVRIQEKCIKTIYDVQELQLAIFFSNMLEETKKKKTKFVAIKQQQQKENFEIML